MSERADVQRLLGSLEQYLRRSGQWSDERPSREALESVVPFCCDHLTLAQWLQFIFIGRLHELLENGDPLPDVCDIAPYAEMVATQGEVITPELLELIQALDAAVTRAE
ncbi:MAG: YqcC family protein [Gammaproteobacteria bacterium]|nr:YqcC family protein [Gammaproteobacteria bacterium]